MTEVAYQMYGNYFYLIRSSLKVFIIELHLNLEQTSCGVKNDCRTIILLEVNFLGTRQTMPMF